MDMIIILFLFCGMTIAAVWDWKTGKIPNLVTFPMILAGLSYHGFLSGPSGLVFSAGGLFLGLGMFLIPYLTGGIGAGDVKLVTGAGAMVGAKGVLIAGNFTILFGLLYAVVLLLIHPDYGRSLFRRIVMNIKALFIKGRSASASPSAGEKRPGLRYALPVALGTMSYAALKITGSHMIQDLLGLRFSI